MSVFLLSSVQKHVSARTSLLTPGLPPQIWVLEACLLLASEQ